MVPTIARRQVLEQVGRIYGEESQYHPLSEEMLSILVIYATNGKGVIFEISLLYLIVSENRYL